MAISDVVGSHNFETLNANALAEKLLGDTIFANVLLLGAAWQAGLVPVSLEGLMRAIELNGVEIEKNKRAFGWGRIAAVNPERVRELIDGENAANYEEEELDSIVRRRAEFLVGYQSQALADRYLALVNRVKQTEIEQGGNGSLASAVARSYFKVLSYKDEYEVARLHTQTGFLDSVRSSYGNKAKVRFHLAPPLLNGRKDARGRPRKMEFGSWTIPVFRLLAGLRHLRGTKLDFFGMTAERRMERQLIVEFESLIDRFLAQINSDSLEQMAEVVTFFLDIRGYGPVKKQAVDEVREKIAAHPILSR
jgi:indolepyruvate ferredoxin oxidoreductase